MPAKNLTRISDIATYSHIYNRGVEERVIFESVADYQVFLNFLKDYLTPQNPKSIKKDFKVRGRTFQGVPHLPKNYFNEVELIAYSLLPDRFHLILHQKTRGSIERFLRSLCTRYSMYFNKKYHRSGSLFEGPYKSVQIKDEHELQNLTGSLHHFGNNSSYPEYLGAKENPWVKPQVVLSLFKNKASDYKNFVEKYQSKNDHLVRSPDRRNPASSYDLPTNQDIRIRSRIPQFWAISTMGFVLLVSFSVWNINVSAAKSQKILPTPAVLSETQEATTSTANTSGGPAPSADGSLNDSQVGFDSPEVNSEVGSEATPEATATGIMSTAPADAVKAEVKPETLRVKIDDGSSFVNIRQKPSLSSEKIGKALDGDTFEFISLNAGWYEIKLNDGSIGFISARYALKEETN